jgi:hypothetical protein
VNAFVESLDVTVRAATPAGRDWLEAQLEEAG